MQSHAKQFLARQARRTRRRTLSLLGKVAEEAQRLLAHAHIRVVEACI